MKIPPHRFVSDGTVDHLGRPVGCSRCPLLHRHPVHREEEPGDVEQWSDVDRRRLGERE